MKVRFGLSLLAIVSLLRADDFAAKFAAVMIDDKTEAKYGPFPYDRALIAQAVDACAHRGAKAVVLKFFFDQPKSAGGDAALREAMRKIPVALQARLEPTEGTTEPIAARFSFGRGRIAAAVRGERAWVPLPELLDTAAAVGFVDFDRPLIPLAEEYRGIAYKSLVVCCLELALDTSARIDAGRIQFGSRFLPVDDSNVFRGSLESRESLPFVSFADLLSGEATSQVVEGRIVIIGWNSSRTPSLPTKFGPLKIHRFFIECLAASYRALKPNKTPEPTP